jgi:hypothetical protein
VRPKITITLFLLLIAIIGAAVWQFVVLAR